MAGALDGIRVIDFGQYIAGPLTGMFLADQGADVVKVDPPGGPRWKTPANATWNRGKRSIVLDLARPEDRLTAQQFVAGADVVIENFRPGIMAKLGLDPGEMTERHPRLVYCSLPGFASDDPRAHLAAWEGVVAAATDTYRSAPGSNDAPRFTAVPIASTFAALIAGTSIGAALLSRERDGRGQRIEVPLFDAMFSAIGANGLSVVGGDVSGGRPNDFGGGVFRCSDGRWALISLAKPRFLERFAAAAGLEGRIDIQRLASDRATRDALSAMLPDLMCTRTAAEWERLGAEADLPLVRVRSAREWIETDHARASATLVPLDDPVLGQTWQPNSPIRLSRSDARARHPARPLDADREALLEEAQVSRRAIAPSSSPRRSALEGVKIIDLSQVLAGPTGTRTLAEFGADVVKINPLEEPGAGIQFSVHRYHTDVNRAKRSILLDLKTAGGMDVFWRLLESADVVLHNFRPGVMERLGIGYEAARQRRPGIIYTSITAFGQGGAWAGRPGYEPFGQAPTGLMDRQGGAGQPAMQPFAVNDYGTGLSSAMATVFALYERERTGEGQRAEASLAFTGSILQTPFLLDYQGKQWDEPRGSEVRGFGPLQRMYHAQDGWFFLGARADQGVAVARIAGLDASVSPHGEELASVLERRFAERSVQHWCAELVQAGIGAHRLVRIADLMQDQWVVAHGLSVSRSHDTGETITTVGPPARLSRTPVDVGRPASSPGADGAAVLHELGLASTDVDALVERGALRLHLATAMGTG